MKTTQEIRDYLAEQKRWYKLMDGADPEFRLVEGMIEALEFVLDRKNEQPEPVLATRHNDNEVINISQTEHIAFDEGFKQGKLVQKHHDEVEPEPATFTTEYFWDCECEKNYIHSKSEYKCGECDYLHHEMPDSRTVEVIKMLSGDLNWAESKKDDMSMSIEEIDHQMSCCDERIEYLMELKSKAGGYE